MFGMLNSDDQQQVDCEKWCWWHGLMRILMTIVVLRGIIYYSSVWIDENLMSNRENIN